MIIIINRHDEQYTGNSGSMINKNQNVPLGIWMIVSSIEYIPASATTNIQIPSVLKNIMPGSLCTNQLCETRRRNKVK